MNTTTSLPLFRQFSSSIAWNAFAYTTHKCAVTLRTFLLYHTLTPQDFSTWATTMSSIFLLLLWLDLGLRKSIPRYAPLFQDNPTRITTQLILLQLTLLTLALPLLCWFISSLTVPLIILASILYLTEGTHTIIRIIYHSYFLNRSFNLLDTAITLTETLILAVAINYIPSHALITTTFALKATASTILCCVSYYTFITYPPQKNTAQESQRMPYRSFIKHSLMMWGSTIIKSISERNFLMLLLTKTTGIDTANLFKLANDAALFFYRTIMKTIGVADTALLSHIHKEYKNSPMQKRMMNQAIKEVTAKIARLVLPLLGGVIGMSFLYSGFHDPFVFYTFLLMVGGYISETLLLPYERFLEVERNYLLLFLSYIPYLIVMVLLILMLRISSIGLFNILLIIHGVRLVSYILIRFFSYRVYGM